jgi:hypothetical protein
MQLTARPDDILLSDTTAVLTVEQCTRLNFGSIDLTAEQTALLGVMNRQIIELCRTLPKPLQDSAVLAVQRHFTGFQLANFMNFFTKFYVPSWSLIYWMQERQPGLSAAELEQAVIAQGLAYFLHMLDDHIADGQIPISHLLLQLRTQAWIKFTGLVQALAAPVEDGDVLIQTTLDRYFQGIHEPIDPTNFNGYCELFRQQLSTTLVVPLVVAKRTGCAIEPLQQSYEAFCIAWRLLDDLRDCDEDTFAGQKSGIYYALSPDYQAIWTVCQGGDAASSHWAILRSYLEEANVLKNLVQQTLGHLHQAQQLAQVADLAPYAQELQALALPLQAVL